MSKLLPIQSLMVAALLGCSLFAQRYPERDHTVFHPPAQTQTKRTSAPVTSTASSPRGAESRHHDVTFTPSASHNPQPVQIPSRSK
jgi:hypothetical protein